MPHMRYSIVEQYQGKNNGRPVSLLCGNPGEEFGIPFLTLGPTGVQVW